MRKVCLIICVIILLAVITGCANRAETGSQMDMPYDIVKEDNDYFLVMKEKINVTEAEKEDTNMNGETSVGGPCGITFEDIEEMLSDIRTGNFTELELQSFTDYFPKDDEGRVKICNLSEMYEPVLPSDLEIDKIYWKGTEYEFLLSQNGKYYGEYILAITYDEYSEEVEKAEKYAEITKCEVYGQENEEDRNAVVTYVNLGGEKWKHVYYSISDENKNYHIVEFYQVGEMENAKIKTI